MASLNSTYIVPLGSDTLWTKYLCRLVESSISRGLNVVIIVIARKMARLFEYYTLNNPHLKNLLENNSDSISVITEHAIPTTLSGASSEDTEVFVIDDFIVYGDTVETISENVYFLSGIKPKIIAIGASQKANVKPMAGDLVFPNPKAENSEEKSCIISSKQIYAFTARNSHNILSLKKPIDLEHTIFEMSLTKLQYASAIANMKDWAREVFPNSIVYEIRHKIPNTQDEAVSITVCMDPYIERIRNNDFNKFRFFIGDSKLRIVSYSPNIWEDNELLSDNELFTYSELNVAWKEYCSELNNIIFTQRTKENDVFEGMFERQFKLRLELCRVVWANYLKSFENALIFKDELERLATKIIIVETPGLTDSNVQSQNLLEIDQSNLEWLLGKKLRPVIYKLLRDSLFRDVSDCIVSRSSDYGLESNSLLPENELERYNSEKASLALMCPSVDTTLSLIFHKLWTEYGLINYKDGEERIRIGENFQSLAKYLRPIYNSTELNENINRWIDERIDLGIVVPKYEYTYATLGRRIWRRYFRPGEREDVMVDVARICTILANDIYGSSPISFEEFAQLLVPELNQICEESNNQISLKYFYKGLFQKGYNNSSDNIPNILWPYLILLKAFDLSSPLSWKESKVARKDNEIILAGSPIYSIDKSSK